MVTQTAFNCEQASDSKNGFQIITIVVACMSTFTTGMLFAWSSPSIPKIVNDTENYNISLEEASYFTVLPPVGSITSAFLYGKLNDRIGRKYTLLVGVIPQITSLVLIATSKSLYVLYAARFIQGFADAAVFSSLPIYVGEISTPKVRGSWGNLVTISIYLGQLAINIIGSYTSIVITACICLVFPVVFASTFFFMPESPYFYLIKGKLGEARMSLRKLRGNEDVEEELIKLKFDVERQMSESGTWKDLFTIQSNRQALYAGMFLRASQQFGGSATFAVYTQYIFLKSGGELSASNSAIIFAGLCTILNICAAFTVDRLGRRRSYFLSELFCFITLLVISVYFIIEQFFPQINLNSVNWLPLAGMIFYVIFYSFGVGIIPTLMLGELFSASIKAKGLTLLTIVFSILISCTTKLFQLLDSLLGLFAPFLFFSVCCLVGTCLTFHFVPETRGQTLEEIQQSLKIKGK